MKRGEHIFVINGKAVVIIGSFDYETSMCICDQIIGSGLEA